MLISVSYTFDHETLCRDKRKSQPAMRTTKKNPTSGPERKQTDCDCVATFIAYQVCDNNKIALTVQMELCASARSD